MAILEKLQKYKLEKKASNKKRSPLNYLQKWLYVFFMYLYYRTRNFVLLISMLQTQPQFFVENLVGYIFYWKILILPFLFFNI